MSKSTRETKRISEEEKDTYPFRCITCQDLATHKQITHFPQGDFVEQSTHYVCEAHKDYPMPVRELSHKDCLSRERVLQEFHILKRALRGPVDQGRINAQIDRSIRELGL